ncbi:nuclear factor erythroid 2-related factor 3 [Dryobates pubescens]|uniref:nuclear factor erythroid 2-related factor 3 n=1 Tax=Dryobates pubescens TaxID=118200 RepID=UPI0023B9CF92|nr:nuclear factor erythroid 2-related factor 3 [Dryobates pubescens]
MPTPLFRIPLPVPHLRPALVLPPERGQGRSGGREGDIRSGAGPEGRERVGCGAPAGKLPWVTDSPELPWVPLPAGPTPVGVRLGPGRAAAPDAARPARDVDLKAYQEALDNYCPHQGGDQLELQEDEEDTNQSNHNCGDSLFSLEGCFQLLSSQMENMLEVNLLEDTQVATSGRGQEPSSSHYNVSLAQTLCHYFSPHEATLLKTDHPVEPHSETRHSQRQDCCPQSDSSITDPDSLLHGSHLTGLFPATDFGNLTAHDNDFDKIKSVSLALEDGSDPIEVSQLFEESGLDLALFLNSSHSTASYSISSEGAIGCNSDTNSSSSCGLEAIGGHSQEHTKYDHVEHPGDSECSRKATLKQFLPKHTYRLPSQAAPTPVLHQQLCMKPSKEVKDKCCNTTDTKLSSDERPANSLMIPFSAEEIVSMPVDAFNTMLAKNQLTDTQVSLLRGIRRRGKNKVAAQNCRKRKLKAILKLEEAVCNLQTQKESLKKEHSQCSRSISRLKQQLKGLYRDIFSHLKDDQGRPVNPRQYVIHCSSEGSLLLIPKYSVKPEQTQDNEKEQKQK